MSRRIGLLSQLLAILLLAASFTGCGGPANTANVVAERPAGPADKVELVMFHFTQR
jgi:hypothetical protein